ncbi:hypothetical protein ACSBR1_004259 [Camellia fascicularis]
MKYGVHIKAPDLEGFVLYRQPWRQKRKTLEMNSIARKVSSTLFGQPGVPLSSPTWELQQWRGIRVKVRNGNLEQALVFMQRKMQSSGIERLIKREQTHHLKNSEKRVLARKNLERKIRSQDLARKLKSILVKKVRGL